MDTELDKFLKRFGGDTSQRLSNSKNNEIQSLTKGDEEKDTPYFTVEVSENLERGQKQKNIQKKNPNDFKIGHSNLSLTNQDGNYMEMVANAIPSLIKKEGIVNNNETNPFSTNAKTDTKSGDYFKNYFKQGADLPDYSNMFRNSALATKSSGVLSDASLVTKSSGGLSNASTGFDHKAFSNRMSEAGNTEVKGGSFKSTAAGVGAVAGAIGNAMGSHQYDNQYMTDKQLKSKDWMEAGKDTAGSIIPMAGMFRGIEKGVVNVAGQTNGDEGAAISQAMFSPSDNVRNIAGSDMSGSEKAKAYFMTVFNPIGAGVMIHKDRMRTQARKKKEAILKENEFEKAKRRETYQMEQGLISMENLKALREKQLGYS